MCVGKIILKKLHFYAKFLSIAIVYTENRCTFVYTKTAIMPLIIKI